MAGSKSRKPRRPTRKRSAAGTADPLRRGLPAKDSVREVVDFVSPQKAHYKILKTTEMDVYDPIPKPTAKRRRYASMTKKPKRRARSVAPRKGSEAEGQNVDPLTLPGNFEADEDKRQAAPAPGTPVSSEEFERLKKAASASAPPPVENAQEDRAKSRSKGK